MGTKFYYKFIKYVEQGGGKEKEKKNIEVDGAEEMIECAHYTVKMVFSTPEGISGESGTAS